ncbi:MAG: S8 family serine peptidase [Dehalococcoidia bacterium]
MNRILLLLLPIAAILLLTARTGPDAESSAAGATGDVIPGRFIVVLQPGANPSEVVQRFGLQTDTYYRRALTGFAAEMTAEQAQQIADDPDVAQVEPSRRVHVTLHENLFQTLTEGADRIDADENAAADIGNPGPGIDADIAVIDTGIDVDHPDLNVMGGFAAYQAMTNDDYDDCNTGTSFDDVHGHGTHVSGTAAAIDNDIGVVGVAPGARLWAVRVLRDDGYGCDEDVILGVDWVTGRQMEYNDGAGDLDPGINFTVANMSLGGDPSPAICAAIAGSVAQGVMYAVAAGNYSQDASHSGPADCSTVVTVSAYADYDGQPGGLAEQVCPDPDDSFAYFSNFGSLVEIAAPGVCVMSTYPNGAYAAMSGTSMATPHVAGALALFKASTGYSGPYDGPSVMSALNSAGWTRPQNSECGFSEDPDNFREPVLYLGSSCSNTTFTPSPTPSPSPTHSPTPTPTASPTPTATPSASPTATATATASPTAVATATASGAPTQGPVDPSDIDCDQQVTGNDSILLIRFAANLETNLEPGCPPIGALVLSGASVAEELRGDLNCSGGVDVADALILLRGLAGIPAGSVAPCAA